MQRRSRGASARPTLRVREVSQAEHKAGSGPAESGGPIGVLSEALKRSPGEVSLMRDLAKLFVHDGELQEAIALLSSALSITKDPQLLKSIHVELALIWDQGLAAPDKALPHLRCALELAPRDEDVLRALSGLLAKSKLRSGEQPARPARSLETRTQPAREEPIRMEARPRTVALEAPRERPPSGSHPKQVSDRDYEELQKRVQQRPEDVSAWRELCAAFERSRKADLAFRCAQVVAILDEGSRPDAPIGRYAVRPASGEHGSFTPALLDEVGFGLMPFGLAGELLRTLEPWIAEMKPTDLSSYGTMPRAKIGPESPHALRKLADRVAGILQAGPFDLYLHRARARGAGLELGSPPALLIPARIEQQSVSCQVFELARLLAPRARGIGCIARLDPGEVQACVRAYVSTVVADFVPQNSRDAFWYDGARRYQAKSSTDFCARARELAVRYAASPVAIATWCDQQKRVMARAAALLADDPRDAYENAPDNEFRLDLLRFWVSPAAAKARARVGIA